jgi:hypothetical protein
LELGLRLGGVDSRGRTIFVADARRGENQRLIVPANEKLTTELAIRAELAVGIGWLLGAAFPVCNVLENKPDGLRVSFKSFCVKPGLIPVSCVEGHDHRVPIGVVNCDKARISF